MWLQRQEVDLDCLSFTNTLQPSNSQNLGSSPFQYKTEFTGYAYWVVVDLDKCHAGIRIQCGSIINIANLNTEEGKYVVDACQLVCDKFSFFPVHYRIGDGQGFTSADDYHHYFFILAVPSTYTKVTKSPLLQLLLKLKPTRSFLPIALLKFLLSCLCNSLTSPMRQQDQEKTPRPSLNLDFLPLPSPQPQQYSDDILDITNDESFADVRRRYDFWYRK